MPYRRLPNTDASRYRALETALNKSMAVHHTELAFSQKVLLQVKSFLPTFKLAMTVYKENSDQLKKLSEQTALNNKALRLYFSHFLQVLNLAIVRGEYKDTVRSYYGLDIKAGNLPDTTSDALLYKWSKKIIEGEELRIREGGLAMTNPRIAMVKIKYETLIQSTQSLKISQQSTKLALAKIAELRDQADALILELWNEIEATYEALQTDERREQCSQYGVKYVFRPGER